MLRLVMAAVERLLRAQVLGLHEGGGWLVGEGRLVGLSPWVPVRRSTVVVGHLSALHLQQRSASFLAALVECKNLAMKSQSARCHESGVAAVVVKSFTEDECQGVWSLFLSQAVRLM